MTTLRVNRIAASTSRRMIAGALAMAVVLPSAFTLTALSPARADPPTPVKPAAHLVVDPPEGSATITSPGGTASLTTTMETTKINPVVDILFVLDTTTSMMQHITVMSQGLAQFVKNVNDAGGVDVAVGVYAFGDLTCSSAKTGKPDAFSWVSPITPLTGTYTTANVATTLTTGLPANYGCDTAEDQIYAGFYASATAGWRDGAQREVVLVTDIGSKTRTDTKYYVNGQAPTLANWKAYTNANAIHVSVINGSGFQVPESGADVKQGDPGYTSWAQLATAFGSDTTPWPYTTAAYVDTLTNAILYSDTIVTYTIVPSVTVKYDDGTTSTDVTATLTPSVATDVGPASVPFTLSATAKDTAHLARLGATTTVTADYVDQATGDVVARQTITFHAPNPDAAQSTLSMNTLTPVITHPATATVTVKDAAGTPLPGITATVTVPSTTSASATGDSGVAGPSATCVTHADGTCKVVINDATSETVSVAAFVPASGVLTEVSNSPIAVTFVPDPTTPGTPSGHLIVDKPDQSAAIPSPGGTQSLTTKMQTTTIAPKVDIVFVLDTTQSMQPRIDMVAQGLSQFIKNVNDAGGVDVAIGVYVFGDFGCANSVTGQQDRFTWVTPLTPLSSTFTPANVADTMQHGLPVNTGCDLPEQQIYAGYYASATAPWRDGAQREIVLLSDISAHNGGWTSANFINGQAPNLVNWKAYVAANSINVNVVNASGTAGATPLAAACDTGVATVTMACLAAVFGSDWSVAPTTPQGYVDVLTKDIVYGAGTPATYTIVPSVTIKYDDGTTSTDVTATLTPSVATQVGPDWVPFTLSATAKATDQLVRLGATTTVTTTYVDQATGDVVARQTITFKAPDPNPVCPPGKQGTHLSADPTSLRVGNTSNITALITDAECTPMANVAVNFSIADGTDGVLTVVSGTTDADGLARATLTDKTAEDVAVSAKLGTTPIAGSPVTVTFTPGPVDPNPNCTDPARPGTNLSANPLSVTAGDPAGSTVTAYLTDAECNPVADGTPVTFSLGGGTSASLSKLSGTSVGGYVRTVVTDDVAEAVQVHGLVMFGSPAVATDIHNSPVTVTFTPGPVDPNPNCTDPAKPGTNLSAAPLSVTAGDPAGSTVTAYLTDAKCNAVADGTPVTFSLGSGTSASLSKLSGTSVGGYVTTVVTDKVVEDVRIHGQVLFGTPAALTDIHNSPVTVSFTPGGVDPNPNCPDPAKPGTNLSAAPLMVTAGDPA
ncbi:MAG: Ig-like domain-containing protein, partial [Actinomycetia bacterium]|nr:Ig-like domain-containing protein [Actinomycetes bacterium]